MLSRQSTILSAYLCCTERHSMQKGKKRVSSHVIVFYGIALAELVSYIEEFETSSAELPTFKLADLTNMYKSCLQRLGCDTTSRVNTSRLKERLVFQIPGLQCYNKGRDVYLAFRDDVRFALHKAHEQDCDEEAMRQRLQRLSVKICSLVNTRFQDHLSLTVRLNPSQPQRCLSLK